MLKMARGGDLVTDGDGDTPAGDMVVAVVGDAATVVAGTSWNNQLSG